MSTLNLSASIPSIGASDVCNTGATFFAVETGRQERAGAKEIINK